MLNPCNPCVCSGAPCEQCMFGYRSQDTKHKTMKEMLIAYNAGKKPDGWQAAENYTLYHKNWREEIGVELPSIPTEEEYKKAIEVNRVLSMSVDQDNRELKKCIDKMCRLRQLILENELIIERNNREVIDKYRIWKQLEEEMK